MSTTVFSSLPSVASVVNARADQTAAAAANPNATKTAKIMVIDDEPLVIRVVRRFLATEGLTNIIEVSDSKLAMATIQQHAPDVVLLDINMPDVNGFDILAERRKFRELQTTPFITLSGSQDVETKRKALELGANEFLSKPVEQFELSVRVRNAIELKSHYDHLSNYAETLLGQVEQRTVDLLNSRRQVIQCLARASEYRDNETGRHVVRVGKFSRVIADVLGFPKDFCENLEIAAQLHDLGKIGIPDAILLCPRRYTNAEYEIMKKHAEIGHGILMPLAAGEANAKTEMHDGSDINQRYPLLTLAAKIARTHHEKWDGSGYPDGLAGEQIPIEGRIVAVADVYDALCSARPYKAPFTPRQAAEIIFNDKNRHFDPRVVDAFFSRIEEIEAIRNNYGDDID